MKVLVTGATGFVGGAIVSEMVEKGFDVFQVGNRRKNREKTGADCFSIDITDRASVERLKSLKDLDVIIHSAGLAHQFGNTARSAFRETNVEGTRNILNLAVFLKTKHFVLISSTAIYGTKKKKSPEVEVIDENSVCRPETFYAESKLEAENVAKDICGENKMKLTIFRPAPVIGEGNSGNVARMIEAIDKKRFVWIGKGENYKSLIYKKDVARACARILSGKKDGTEVFNLAAEPILMADFVSGAAKYLGRKVPQFSISPVLFEKFFQLNGRFFRMNKIEKLAATVEKWLSDDVYSARKFEREYNFKPETDISEALKLQIYSYLERKS